MNTAQYNMFCLPSAGSSASIYYSWKKRVAETIRIIPIEYPGHGSKIKQPLLDNPDSLAQHIANEIQCYPAQPFILFGHSVGGGLIWKVWHYLKDTPIRQQLKLMVISSRPEHASIQHLRYKHQLPDLQIIEELKRYNHFPDEILNNPEALQFFLKIIRNDFYISDQLLTEKISTTDVPVMAFYGKADPDIPNQAMMDAWQQHTETWLGSIALEGDHFYFFQQQVLEQVLEKIAQVVHQQRANA